MSKDTILDPTQAAIVTDKDGGFALYVPDYAEDDEAPVPDNIMVLAALMARLTSDDVNEWIAPIVEQFQKG